jgi:type IV pilus assembly protein PilA
MKRAQQGFTLIELMIVIAIVGILAAVALPAYQDYTVRAKMSEVIARGSEAKTSVAEMFASEGDLDRTTAPFNTGPSGKVRGVAWEAGGPGTGRIVITIGSTGTDPSIAGETLAIGVLSTQNGVVTWQCGVDIGGDTSVDQKFLPSSCK